jgi:signal peptidase I
MKTMRTLLRIVLRIIKVFLVIVLGIIIIRLCFFDIFKIPADSMLNALKRKDYIIINKTLYGGILSGLLKSNPQPAQNDLFVFKDNQRIVVKRCIGLPGTTIEVITGRAWVNDSLVQEPLTVRHYYKIWVKNYAALNKAISECGIDIFRDHFKNYPNCISAYLDHTQKNQLSQKKGIDSITLCSISDDYPDAPDSTYEIQNTPRVFIPYRGMKIKIDSITVNQYSNILTTHEKVHIKQLGSDFFMNGMPVREYVFKNDYYFFMGDNRDNSEDSRYFGLIPQKKLLGKVIAKI